jgi:hypothetical protein
MANKINIDYQKSYQRAFDYLSATCHASTTAENKFKKIFDEIIQRSIDDKYADGKDDSVVDLNNVYFIATDDEKTKLRELYLEWQAYKLLWQEKDDELNYLKANGKELNLQERADDSYQKNKMEFLHSVMKIISHLIFIVASLTVIAKFTF